MGMLFTSFLLLVLPWCQWHRQLGVAAVLVGAAADVELVSLGLRRVADQRPGLGFESVLIETSINWKTH